MTKVKFTLTCEGKKAVLLYKGETYEEGCSTLTAEPGFPADALDYLQKEIDSCCSVKAVIDHLSILDARFGYHYYSVVRPEILESGPGRHFMLPSMFRFHFVCGGKKGSALWVGEDSESDYVTLEVEDGFPADAFDHLQFLTEDPSVDEVLDCLSECEDQYGLTYKIEIVNQSNPPIFVHPYWRPRLVTTDSNSGDTT